MATLYVCLPSLDASPTVALAHAQGVRAQAATPALGSGAVAALPAASDIVVLVPPTRLAWHRVRLPKGSGIGARGGHAEKRLLQLLAGVLEDRLLQDPALLHFAVHRMGTDGPRTDGDEAWVAVVQRDWLQGWVDLLTQAGRAPQRILAQWAPALDESQSHLHISQIEQSPMCLARSTTGCVALPLTRDTLAALPQLMRWPDTWTCSVSPALAAQAEALLGNAADGQPRRAAIVGEAQVWAQIAEEPWDLAQFELANQGSARLWRRVAGAANALATHQRWRAARWGLAAALAVQLIGLNAWAWHQQRALQAKRDAIAATVTQTFPAIRVVVDPVVQMERETARLLRASGQAQSSDLEPMLGALGLAWQQALPQLPIAIHGPRTIEYAGGEMRLRGLQAAPSQAQALQQGLAPVGLRSRVEGEVWTLNTAGGAP